MHKNTKRLRAIMRKHGLSAADVGAIVGRKAVTVNIWRCKNPARIIPPELLKLVELTVAART